MECALALGHLDLPALTALSITVVLQPSDSINDLKTLLPQISHDTSTDLRSQDIQPLQSMRLSSGMNTAIIHAWSVTDIDALVQESSYSTFSATNFTPRLALSFRSIDGLAGDDDTGRNILDAALLVLPLSNLDTLLVQRFKVPPEKSFWLRHVPKWPFLRRVKLEETTGNARYFLCLQSSS